MCCSHIRDAVLHAHSLLFEKLSEERNGAPKSFVEKSKSNFLVGRRAAISFSITFTRLLWERKNGRGGALSPKPQSFHSGPDILAYITHESLIASKMYALNYCIFIRTVSSMLLNFAFFVLFFYFLYIFEGKI
jgi:hypothetical protein